MRWCFLLSFLMYSLTSFSLDVTGRVVDGMHQEPLIGVNIHVKGSLTGTVTDHDGWFTLATDENIDMIQISYVGYQSVETMLPELEQEGEYDLGTIELELGIELATYYFTAYVPDNYSRKYHGSNETVSLESLRFQNPLGSEEVLKTLTGINVSGDMGISNRLNVGIRGSYPRRAEKILVLEDGSPIAPAPYLSPSAYYNPPTERLDGIEVIKGVDILEFGGNSMHGAVNYITRKPPTTPQLNVRLTGGSQKLNSQFMSYGGTWDKLSAEVQFLHKYFGGYQDNSSSRILNFTTKVLGQLDERNSLYLKLNYHHENSQATYSGLTPLTFDLDPEQSPFDADDLLTNRYAIDLAHTYQKSEVTLSSKLFAHQFTRDWWRQSNTVISASDISEYLGEDIVSDRYNYLQGLTFSDDDYVRVGKLTDGKEGAKARNRIFRVSGIQERFHWGRDLENRMSVGIHAGADYHVESFGNQEIKNDSSRFARSGELILDKQYLLHAASSFLKIAYEWNGLNVEPIFRYEWIKMSELNKLAVSMDPNNNGARNYGKIFNSFSSFIPGISISYAIPAAQQHTFYAGVYKGFNPPTSGYGFLTVEEGGIVSGEDDAPANIKSETSLNFEVGFRTNQKGFSGQLSYFNNHIKNFYSAGRKEAFQSLGNVNIQGLEVSADLDILDLTNVDKHDLDIGVSLTWLKSEITGGRLVDSDLLKAKHNDATKNELIEKINAQRNGFVLYTEDDILAGPISIDDLEDITAIEMLFGEGGITGNRAPYNPNVIFSGRLRYVYDSKLSVGMQINHTGEQYTEYLNFVNETSEGAIGLLEAYTTLDLSAGYVLEFDKAMRTGNIPGVEFFFAAKNVSGNVYKASRLHRLSSGIMPGGFRSFQGGLKVKI